MPRIAAVRHALPEHDPSPVLRAKLVLLRQRFRLEEAALGEGEEGVAGVGNR